MAGFDVAFGVDPSGFKTGMVQAGESAEDLAKSLDAVAKKGTASGEKLTTGAKEGAQALKAVVTGADHSDQAVQRLEEQFRQLATESSSANQSIRQDEQETTSQIELSSRERRKIAREALGEVRENAKQAAAQGAADIDGSIGGLANAASSTLTGILSAMPPQFAALGAVGVAAFGLISGAVERNQESIEEVKEKAADLAKQYIETGKIGRTSAGYINDALKEMATQTDDSKTSLTDLHETAERSKSDYRALAQAVAGNTKGLQENLTAAKEKLAVDKDQNDTEQTKGLGLRATTKALVEAKAATQEQTDAQSDYVDYLQKAQDAAKQAAEDEKFYAEAGGKAADERKKKADEASEALKTQSADLETAAIDWQTYWDASKNVFDVAGYLKTQADEASKVSYVSGFLANPASGLTDAAKGFLQQQGTDAASAMLKGYQAATPAQQAQLNALWTTQGQNDGYSYTKSAQSYTNSHPIEIAMRVNQPDWAGIVKAAQNTVDRLPAIRFKTTAGRFGEGVE